MSGETFFEDILEQALGRRIEVQRSKSRSGGCINNALSLFTNEGDFFLKWQKGIPDDMFEKEARGLKLLAGSGAIKIPEVYSAGKIGSSHFLLMENIESAAPSNDYWEDFGIALANMHRENTGGHYGLDHDNYIGKLPQPNDEHDDWINFFIEKRLEFQLVMAMQNGLVSHHLIDRYRKFYDFLPDLLPVDQPALLHGDMWSGNVMVGNDGKVCLIDPAVYHGHREIELSFTQMFGGFSREFYRAYHEAYPLEPGFQDRVDIYNIYPHMVHVNLFGPSYLGGVESVLNRYVG
jgi:fructosamine-3-kinase